MTAPPAIGDGAYGTELAEYLDDGEVADGLCARDPGAVIDLHRAYLEAGATVLQTNSFMVWDLPDRYRDGIYRAAVKCAREAAAGGMVEVAVTVGPAPAERLGAEIERAARAGADSVLVETITDQASAQVAIDTGARINLPLTVSMSIVPSRAREQWNWLGSLDAPAGVRLGLNCCEGATASLREPLELLAACCEQIHLAPSSHLPGQTAPDPGTWAESVHDLAKGLPVAVIAGCCSITPEHISMLGESGS